MSKVTVLESWIEICYDLFYSRRGELAAILMRPLVWQTERSFAKRFTSLPSDTEKYLVGLGKTNCLLVAYFV